MGAELTYMIWEGILSGRSGGQRFFVSALSGVAGGSTKLHPSRDSNNPYSTGLKAGGTIRGGPIPNGRYRISPPRKSAHLGMCARLTPQRPAAMMGRGGFYIHGRGPKGSDGCIVPLDKHAFNRLMRALDKDGGGWLRVVDTTSEIGFA